MKVSILTYNLLLNKAAKELEQIIGSHNPDFLFFQELATDDKNLRTIEKLNYRLADYSNSFMRWGKIYGVATFYKPQTFNLINSTSFSLPSSLYQMITFIIKNKKNPRTVLRNEFQCKKNGKFITTYNIHLTPVATNTLRLKQIINTFHDLHLSKKNSIIIAGDFNYPYGRKKFETIIQKYKLKEATNNIDYTLERKILKTFSIKLKLDYVLYKNIKIASNKKIQVKYSDHYPILSTFTL
ncbi:MAG: endonuclease/exonuclease/phosphatase family protein [Patescibacteria group bacterium]